jgi:hypothetical protein
MSNWRPESWKNEHITPNTKEPIYPEYQVFGAGGDAMLEALRKLGKHYNDVEAPYKTVGILMEIKERGTLVFIPDDNGG